jgi:hypothetical protein
LAEPPVAGPLDDEPLLPALDPPVALVLPPVEPPLQLVVVQLLGGAGLVVDVVAVDVVVLDVVVLDGA